MGGLSHACIVFFYDLCFQMNVIYFSSKADGFCEGEEIQQL